MSLSGSQPSAAPPCPHCRDGGALAAGDVPSRATPADDVATQQPTRSPSRDASRSRSPDPVPSRPTARAPVADPPAAIASRSRSSSSRVSPRDTSRMARPAASSSTPPRRARNVVYFATPVRVRPQRPPASPPRGPVVVAAPPLLCSPQWDDGPYRPEPAMQWRGAGGGAGRAGASEGGPRRGGGAACWVEGGRWAVGAMDRCAGHGLGLRCLGCAGRGVMALCGFDREVAEAPREVHGLVKLARE